MAQISRKELKSDEFVSGMDAAYEFFLEHRDRIIIAAVVVAVLAVAAYGVISWRNTRSRTAATMLAQALNTLHEPLLSTATPKGTAAYASVATRGAAAAKQFQVVVSQYPSTTAGQLALYYLGLAQLDAKNPGAEKNLQAAANSSDGVVSVAAKHALANLAIERGDFAKAHALLVGLTQQDSPTLPRAVVLMELADLDRSYNPKEAVQYYRELEANYPATATAQAAQQQLTSLQH
ncbi:MAG: tetratricopeptide repeat protein [Terriglobales bacterium]